MLINLTQPNLAPLAMLDTLLTTYHTREILLGLLINNYLLDIVLLVRYY